jgi:protoheme IX farnesyltransferase
MALIGALALGLYTNALTLGLGVLSLVSYLLVYTPLKRTTSFCTVVGALPGALPPVMGWTAVRNEISTGAALLFAILFLWQLPHFLAFAWLKREDYAAGGFPMLSVVDPDGDMLARQVLLYCVALLPASLAPSVMGLAGWTYFHVALGLGIALTGFAAALAVFRTPQIARTMFWASLVYLPALLTALMADRILP